MDDNELLSFYKWLTNIGLVLFVAFSYFLLDPVSELHSEVSDINEQIEVDNAAIDNTTNNATKVQLIKANLAKAENASEKSMLFNMNLIGSVVFIITGLALMAYGLINVRKLVMSSGEEEI